MNISDWREAKRRVEEKRFRRLELMENGMSHEHACVVVRLEENREK